MKKFSLKKNNVDAVKVTKKAVFDKSANWTCRTGKCADTASIMSGFNFFRFNSASNAARLSAVKRGKIETVVSQDAFIETETRVKDTFAAVNAHYEETALFLVPQYLYDAYAHAAKNGKFTCYDVFAVSCVEWIHSLGFNATSADVASIAMAIGFNVSSGKYAVETGENLRAVSPRVFAKKCINALSDCMGQTVKKVDFETLKKRANIK